MPFDTAPKLGMIAMNGNARFDSLAAEINKSVFIILPVTICEPLKRSGIKNAQEKITVSNVIIFFIETDIVFNGISIPFLDPEITCLPARQDSG